MAQVSSQLFGAKFAGKREVFRFLTHDCGVYLSSFETMTVFHMRDIVSNKRTKILSKDIKHVIIPQFEGLACKNLMDFALKYDEVMRALPLV